MVLTEEEVDADGDAVVVKGEADGEADEDGVADTLPTMKTAPSAPGPPMPPPEKYALPQSTAKDSLT